MYQVFYSCEEKFELGNIPNVTNLSDTFNSLCKN